MFLLARHASRNGTFEQKAVQQLIGYWVSARNFDSFGDVACDTMVAMARR